MPIVKLPASLCPKKSAVTLEVNNNSLQTMIADLINSPDAVLEKFKIFITKDKNNIYQFKGLIVCVNEKMIIDSDCNLQPMDHITFIPAVSGG